MGGVVIMAGRAGYLCSGCLAEFDRYNGAAGYTINNYDSFGGTSGASSHRFWCGWVDPLINPNLTASQVQTILQNTADDVNGGGWDTEMGYGRVNANRAVELAFCPIVTSEVRLYDLPKCAGDYLTANQRQK